MRICEPLNEAAFFVVVHCPCLAGFVDQIDAEVVAGDSFLGRVALFINVASPILKITCSIQPSGLDKPAL